MGTPVVGKAYKLGIDTANPVTKQFEFLWPLNFGKRGTLVESNGLRGTRERFRTGVNAGPYTVGGRVSTDVRPDTADSFWNWILGGTEDSDTFSPAETIPSLYVTIDRSADVATYAGCKVASADLSGRSGEDLRLEMDLEGTTETLAAAGSFPSIASSLSVLQPYIFHQGVYQIGAANYEFDQFRITINNALILDRFMNTQYRTSLPEGDRIVTLQSNHPWTTTEKAALYDLAVAGLSARLYFTNGSHVMTIAFANLKAPVQPPNVRGRELEVNLPLNFTAYADPYNVAAIVPSIKITNVWSAGSGV